MNEGEDIVLDTENLDDSVVAEEHQGEAIQKLKGKLKEIEGKAKEYLDGWQRERADIANARKRDEENKREFVKFATEGLVIEILSVLDSFDMAALHGNKDLEPVRKQLLSVLETQGLKVLEPKVGDAFDPREHESVGVVKVDKQEDDHKILEIVQKGYILSPSKMSDTAGGTPVGKIIRPAKVKLGEFN